MGAANKLHNDPAQTIPASNAALDDVESFHRATVNFQNLTSSSMAMIGAAGTSMANAGARVAETGTRFKATQDPRIEAIRQGAEDATRVGDEGASALNATDIVF